MDERELPRAYKLGYVIDLPEAVSTGGIVLIVVLAAIALVVVAVVRFWWQLDHDEIEAEAGGSYEDQFGGDDLPDDK